MTWYQQNTEQIYQTLRTTEKGLAPDEAAERLKRYGPNQLALKKDPLWKVIIEPFRSLFIGVLLAAAIVSFLSHEVLDAIIIGVIVLVGAIVFYTQQYATTRVLRSLKRQSVQRVAVLRGRGKYGGEHSGEGERGGEHESQVISSLDLVPGDVIILYEGERVSADARIVHAGNLQIDESTLTGESVPVHKHAAALEAEKEIYEQTNMAFQGTYVVAGTGTAVVVTTGSRTEFGKIAALASDEQTQSPVQAKIDQLITMLVKFIGLVSIVVFLLSLARGTSAGEALRFVLALAVSVVPEGLPVALTVIIVLGMRRMARQKALVRSFKAIEDIGLVTTIATDKTGTLTKNHLSVVDSWSLDEPGTVAGDATGTPGALTDMSSGVMTIAPRTLDIDGNLSDPLDIAIAETVVHSQSNSRTATQAVNAGSRINGHTATLATIQPDVIYPFDLSLRMSGAYSQHDQTIYLKGSPEHVLANAKLTKHQRHEAESVMHSLASKGYRVIAFGTVPLKAHNLPATVSTALPPKDLSGIGKNDISFAGFLAFADELRPETPQAIQEAHQAGISVRLITGDHYETAFHIGKQIGLTEHAGQVIQGSELPKDATPQALALAIQDKTVFARILPEDKFRILNALKQTEITAMTGDGVNDVPALANAHVGIAMGSGSDIARDAGGIVLLDDNFATIIKAIAEGRKIFANIRRMLFYLLATSMGEVITMIGALLFGLPLPVTAIQILWVNLVTDTAMVIPLGLEPEETGHMKRPPRRPKDPLLGKLLLSRVAIVALATAAAILTIVYILHQRGHDTMYIQTVAFMALIAAQWMNAFNARSEYGSSFSRLKQPNRGLLVGFAIGFGMQMLVMFGPLGHIFDIQDVPLATIVAGAVGTALAVLAAAELHKVATRRPRSARLT